MKDLPEMYHNKIYKEIPNNRKVFSTMYDKFRKVYIGDKEKGIKKEKNYTVEQKIYNIFNSPNYIYKVDVAIVTDSETFNKRIVGKTKSNLITFDGEYIPIDKIRDIYITR